ncbi:MAG: substrate-binding domain-containing protein [Clostridiaceae bacterium]|nr:substrate-binding domain-containing protein [Clostridiaceae bacterium]
MYAIGSMRAILEKGLSIPGDVSVVGFDNSELSRYCHPPLTTFGLPLKRMGELAYQLLTGNLDNKIGKLQINADFIIRDSVRH